MFSEGFGGLLFPGRNVFTINFSLSCLLPRANIVWMLSSRKLEEFKNVVTMVSSMEMTIIRGNGRLH